MAIAFIAAATGTQSGGISVVVNRPTGVVQGDVMVAVVNVAGGGFVITPPSGWTQIRTNNDGVGYAQTAWYKVAGASEPSSYTFTVPNSRSLVGVILGYSGVDTTTPVDVSSGQAAASGTTITAPSVTTTDTDRVVLVPTGSSNNTTISTPSGTTSRASAAVGGVGATMRVSDFSQPTAGATGNKTATIGVSSRWVGQQIALIPANNAPNAPTLTAPTGGVTVDRTAQIDLQGTFSDPDAGDQLSEVTVRYRQVGAGSWTEVTQAASGTTFSVPITGGTLTAGDHEWQAKTKDAAGVEGPYSGSAFFTAASPPAAPVITAPSGTITEDPSLTEWTAPNQDALQVQTRSAAAGGGTLYHDSGTVVSTTRAYSTPRPVNNRTEYTRVRVRFGGLWSPYAERSDLVAYTPPETPTIVATATPEGWFDIAFTNPAGDTATVSNELRRQQSDDGGTTWTDEDGTVDAYNTIGIAPAATYTDARKIAHRRLYRWQPVAVGDNGTRAVGAWTT